MCYLSNSGQLPNDFGYRTETGNPHVGLMNHIMNLVMQRMIERDVNLNSLVNKVGGVMKECKGS